MTQAPPDMKLRISLALRRQIEEAAKVNNRTLNSEIVARLEQSFAGRHAGLSFLKKVKQSAAGYSNHEVRIAALEGQLEILKEHVREAGIKVSDE